MCLEKVNLLGCKSGSFLWRKNSCCSCLSLNLTTYGKLSKAPNNGLKNRITKENKESRDKAQRAKISYRSDLRQGKGVGSEGAPRGRQQKQSSWTLLSSPGSRHFEKKKKTKTVIGLWREKELIIKGAQNWDFHWIYVTEKKSETSEWGPRHKQKWTSPRFSVSAPLLNDTLNITVDNNCEKDGKTEKVTGNTRAKPERMYNNIICI